MAADPGNESPATGTVPSHLHGRAASPAGSHFADSRWQRRLLPFLVGTLGILTVLFCAAIAWETRYIQNRMETPLQLDLRPAVSQEFHANANFLLEANLIERRYRAAAAAALSRIYLMFLGFGTGMVMALVGATFILGKISEPETSIDGAGSSFKASLHSGSPGVILAFLGTVLMLCTIFSKTEINLSDRAIYMGAGSEQGAQQQPDAQPATQEKPKKTEPGRPETDKQPAGAPKSAPGTQAALVAKNETRRPDEQIVMSSLGNLDGDYTLKTHSGAGTLSIRGHAVQFTVQDGKKMQVNVAAFERSHLTFSVIQPNGGQDNFDGFQDQQGDIVGTTTYQGGYSTTPTGFTATRIKRK
jgi:hypothetical protein